jgi:hypothetical protein
MASPRLQPSPDVVLRTVADETFLLPVRGDLMNTVEMFVLSDVGRFIWSRLDGVRRYEDLVTEVLGEFDVSEEPARKDVREFLDQLQAYGLVSVETE